MLLPLFIWQTTPVGVDTQMAQVAKGWKGFSPLCGSEGLARGKRLVGDPHSITRLHQLSLFMKS
jgi:hypothetical protein